VAAAAAAAAADAAAAAAAANIRLPLILTSCNCNCSLCGTASRLVALDDACCADDAAVCDEGSGIPTTCDVACGAVLLPLLGDCGTTINRMFDGLDGVYDGTATQFVTLRATCVSVSIDALLSYIREMQADGCRLMLNGVAETTVDMAAEAACSDAKASCGMSVRDELLTCADDCASRTEFVPAGSSQAAPLAFARDWNVTTPILNPDWLGSI
jgi:hypothetical protein